MRVEIINTGTELLIGDVINTNVAWVGRALMELGITVERSTCVPDGLAIQEALAESCSRSDLVIVTGGLGPTDDDVSREAASAVFAAPLLTVPESMARLEAYFAARGKPVNEHNQRQALAPRGATVLTNHHGTAPGLYLPAALGQAQGLHCGVFLLPGPPRELKPMMEAQVLPIIRDLLHGDDQRECLYLKFTGLGESDVSMAIQAHLDALPGLEVGYCLGQGDIDVRLMGSRDVLTLAEAICRRLLPEYLLSTDRRILEEVVVDLLRQQGQWLATAESCTGGRIASRITDVSGASAVFAHGFVTYGNDAKEAHLGVPADLLAEHGAVSAPVAAAMAEGCLRASGAQHAIAVTGIAGPTGESEGKPTGTVYLALASQGRPTWVAHRCYRGDRERFKVLTSQAALDLVRRRLCGYGLPAE